MEQAQEDPTTDNGETGSSSRDLEVVNAERDN